MDHQSDPERHRSNPTSPPPSKERKASGVHAEIWLSQPDRAELAIPFPSLGGTLHTLQPPGGGDDRQSSHREFPHARAQNAPATRNAMPMSFKQAE